MNYNHRVIEEKWQAYWLKNKTFKAKVDHSKPKYYVLDMFPFPSGAGLHVGHVEGYTATDILARYKRMKGFNVLHPMGWDSFGLPAEQYAIRTGTHPKETTKQNVDTYRRQLRALGFSYDWEREFATSDPSYYKWTQWIFTKLYEKGLAYQAEMLVNYCPKLGTVLANEEIEGGLSKEGGYPVERRPLKQWIFKITAYAEKLLQDLDLVDWPEGLKRLQRNWIGKSEGAQITFQVSKTDDSITVFTTAPHTLFGASYLVLAPEHPLIAKITTEQQRNDVLAYQEKAKGKSDLERTELSKEKSGVFTGAYAINPANQQEMPIWISDYVLMHYGTGAIMAVPAHDERDFEFATLFKLPIIPVVDPSPKAPLPEGLSFEEARDQVFHGKLCWMEEGTCMKSNNAEVSLNGLSIPDAKGKMIDWLELRGFGKGTITYKLRDWLFSRQRYWGEPFPIYHFEDGSKRTLEMDELPLELPDIEDFKPSPDGRSPLAKVKEWVHTTDPKTGRKAMRDTDTMPNWAGSCWYYLRFCDPLNNKEAWSKEAENYWLPVDMYIGGVEHAVLHLLYARFWHKVLYDCGLVSTSEPFQALRNQGLIVSRSYQQPSGSYVFPELVVEKKGVYTHRETGEVLTSQIEKMSKSKLNGVTPDQVIEEFGADSLRLYEMFMGPLDREKVWNTDAVSGCRRFLQRIFAFVTSDKLSDESSLEASKLAHKLVRGVEGDIEAMQFNTAVAKMMEFINDFQKLERYPKDALCMLVQCLSPFAPHIAEELWQMLGQKEELSFAPWPKVNEALLVKETATYVVQINGKLRGRFDLPCGKAQEELLAIALEQESIAKLIDGKKINKVIFVPDKLLNIVVQ